MELKAVKRFRALAAEKPMKVGRQFCGELTRRVVQRTPVDRGEARGGWKPGLNTVRLEVDGALDPTATLVPLEAAKVLAAMKPGDEYSLANSVAHIGPLEYGHSQQAPAGMLGVTIAEAPSLWREIAEGRR